MVAQGIEHRPSGTTRPGLPSICRSSPSAHARTPSLESPSKMAARRSVSFTRSSPPRERPSCLPRGQLQGRARGSHRRARRSRAPRPRTSADARRRKPRWCRKVPPRAARRLQGDVGAHALEHSCEADARLVQAHVLNVDRAVGTKSRRARHERRRRGVARDIDVAGVKALPTSNGSLPGAASTSTPKPGSMNSV